jgi:cytochrome c oxidase assembly protein subunit 15
MFRLSALVLVLTGMEGALGALVVHENLKTGVITMHMFLSLIILLVQAYIVFKSSAAQPVESEFPALKKFILASLVFTTVQILIGTQVREHVDALLKNFDANSRGDILDNTGTVFPLHAFFAWLVLAVNLFVVFRIYKDTLCRPKLQSHALLILLVLGLEIGAGEILKVFALPAIVQPIHLLIASLLFGLQWSLYLRTNSKSPHPLPS